MSAVEPHWAVLDAPIEGTWFTSDLHFGHQNIISYCNRPYDSVPEMNDGLVDNWNAVVGTDDLIFVLGDVAMGRLDDSLRHVKRLNGRKYLVLGNHDRPWMGNKKAASHRRQYLDAGFLDMFDRAWLTLGNVTVGMCHFPSSGDSQDQDRYTQWRPSVPGGRWLLHGHVHDTWKLRPDHREINVGCDVWDYRPVSAAQLLTFID